MKKTHAKLSKEAMEKIVKAISTKSPAIVAECGGHQSNNEL